MAFIEVNDISKEYPMYKREKGMLNNLKSLFHREYTVKKAVKNINFQIERGESVAYIGMNGAGKSTTIKMLSGILTPSSGEITVGALIPYENRKENALQMGVVFGQRSRLNWDLPMSDTFELYQKMYNIEKEHFQRNLQFYIELLGMEEFINHPVRQLSLGEKMRANLAAALLHDPSVVYLDEPTIGLDVVAKGRIQEFITEINKKNGVTVMLTTHDMTDIEKICNRIIFIHKGAIFFDGSLSHFKKMYGSGYKVVVTTLECLNTGHPMIHLESKIDGDYTFSCDKKDVGVAEVIAFITNQKKSITGIRIEETSVESIVKWIVKKYGEPN